MDFARARRTMVDCQVRPNGVTDPRIIAAMDDVPREIFVPPSWRDLAYLDKDIEIAPGHPPRVMMQAAVLAKLLQAAEIIERHHVLDIGCGTGYGAAVLARIAGSVVGLECDPALAGHAENLLKSTAPNVQVILGPLETGVPQKGPFDVIFIEGAIEAAPLHFAAQLKDGGRLLCVSQSGSVGKAMVYVKTRSELSGRVIFDAVLPLLPGFSRPAAFAL